MGGQTLAEALGALPDRRRAHLRVHGLAPGWPKWPLPGRGKNWRRRKPPWRKHHSPAG